MNWRPKVSATPRRSWGRKRSPKAIVRAAGPQKRWVYAANTTLDTSGIGLARTTTPVLLASDYEDNQGQQRERVVLDQFSMKGMHRMDAPVANNSTYVEIMQALWTADLEVAADIASGAVDPFTSPATFEEYDVQLLRTWGYVIGIGQSAAPVSTIYGGLNPAKYVAKAYNLRLRMREPTGLYLQTVQRGVGTGQDSSFLISFRIKMRSW